MTTQARDERQGGVVQAAADALAVPAWQVPDDALGDGVREIDQAVRLLTARATELAAQAQQRGLPGRGGHRRLSGWVRAVLPTAGDGEASRLADRAETLFLSSASAELAPTREALLQGRVSGAQADVVTGAIARLVPPAVPAGTVDGPTLAEAQTFLLSEARALEPKRLARIARYLCHRLDPDADERLARDEQRQQQVRGLTLAPTGSGMVHVEGLLTPRCGAVVKAAVDAWAAPQPAADGTPDPRTAAQRRHDALERLCQEAIAQPGLLPRSHGSPYRVVVKVTAETLAAVEAGGSQQGLLPAELPAGQPVCARSLAEIACGAELVAVLMDGHGNPLDVGRTQYPFPAKQRLAIAVRDEQCTWPGCTAPPAWCDVHHLQAWSRGGSTCVTNGALLCGRHHRHVHATGAAGRLVDGTVRWSTGSTGRLSPETTTPAARALEPLVRRWLARRRM